VVYLQLPPSLARSTGEGCTEEDLQAEREFLRKVRTNLANNTAVVVKDFKSGYNMDFNVRDFERMGRQLDRPVQAQGVHDNRVHSPMLTLFSSAYIDAKTRPESWYTESTLEKFIEAAEDPTTCCNVLDYCTLVGESPGWLRYVYKKQILRELY
jgi:hypothetical protein